MQNEKEKRAEADKANMDAAIYGTGFLWVRPDGTHQHLPLNEVVLFSHDNKPCEICLGKGGWEWNRHAQPPCWERTECPGCGLLTLKGEPPVGAP